MLITTLLERVNGINNVVVHIIAVGKSLCAVDCESSRLFLATLNEIKLQIFINIICWICVGSLSVFSPCKHIGATMKVFTIDPFTCCHCTTLSLFFNLILTEYRVYWIKQAIRIEQHWQLIGCWIDIFFSYFRTKPRGTLQRYYPHMNQANGS